MTHSNDERSVMAMSLWNDWNTQVLRWERMHANESDFDYIVVRSEDLLNPDTKLEMLVRLAQFVKSPLSIDGLSELSKLEAIDFGESISWSARSDEKPATVFKASNTNKGAEKVKKLHERYGKWKHMEKDNPALYAKLLEAGAAGLAAFGYAPRENYFTPGSDTSQM